MKNRSGKALAGILRTLILLALASWAIWGWCLDSLSIGWASFLNNIWFAWLFPDGWNLLHATPLFWMLVVTLLAAVVIPLLDYRFAPFAVSTLAAVGVLAFVSTTFMWGDWNARYYNSETEYAVQDLDELPNTLSRVQLSDRSQVDIVEGDLPDSWETRTASATGAGYVMKKTGDTIQNSELLEDTVAYIYGDTENTGEWTAIRNGMNRQPIFGVVSWSGTGEKVSTCKFTGDNKLNKAFNGTFGMNLNNSIASFQPRFVYDMLDVYGYCDDGAPVIVIPGAKMASNGIQAAIDAAGVITVRGSKTGQPVMEYFDEVAPGDLPGPAYPTKLVDDAREAVPWSAGRVWPWQPKVGFTAAQSQSQEGNTTDFLLKSSDSGRLYWVTPLKPSEADSETISAYMLTAADEIAKGTLNQTVVYTLQDEDSNIVNFNDLENAVRQAVSKADPGFFTGSEESSGRIVEFLPTSSSDWRVFAERGGRAVYQVNVSGGAKLQTRIVDLGGDNDLDYVDTGVEAGLDDVIDDRGVNGESGTCADPQTLTESELASCISQFSTELSSRLSHK